MANRQRKPRSRSQTKRTGPIRAWFHQQRNAVRFSLNRLWFNPVSTWITLAAIAIALSLPTSLHLLLNNMQTLTDDKREVPTITLFMKQNVNEQQTKDRAELLKELPEVSAVQVITREEAMEDFKQIGGFAETLETLPENPLPHVLILTPKLSFLNTNEALTKFSDKLKAYREVGNIQVDIEWIKKLRSILNIADRIVLVVSVLLGLTMLLVIGNTIRLDIQNRKEEITVTRLIGATNTYIRRPFILGGFWLGLFGGVISLVIVHFALLFLIAPVNDLAREYGSNFTLHGINFTMTLQILVLSSVLGTVGAWLAVSQYLWKSEVVSEN
ncbi:MAG: Cell division protein FtsX [uncultured Thiotrichaceae bacterium]|uniref:Cell division protein FtsX n=1 Tax=uncultured Thiotrichaceae bacterium TaxID=298394 RepID=A0A6S6UAX7_9GAMM|nr:MAG: Cell division protein FtsX [uncultured Thiotrichaceae bacterium]